MQALPLEIVHLIISLVEDIKDLASVCRACHTLLSIGQDYLYREIQLVGLVKTIKLLRLLALNSQLAKRVRKLVFHPFSGQSVILSWNMATGSIFVSLLHLFSRALQACTGLRSLVLHEYGSYGWVLNGVTFRLTELETWAMLDVSMKSFLERQDSLLILCLGEGGPFEAPHILQSLSADSCPRLSKVVMPSWAGGRLIRHRPIVSFTGTFRGDEPVRTVIDDLATSTGPVQTISLVFMYRISFNLPLALTVNQSLRHLTIADGCPGIADPGQGFGLLTSQDSLLAFASMPLLENLTIVVLQSPAPDMADLESAASKIEEVVGAACSFFRVFLLVSVAIQAMCLRRKHQRMDGTISWRTVDTEDTILQGPLTRLFS